MSHLDGVDDGVGYGVKGTSANTDGKGVQGISEADRGVGVHGQSGNGLGVYGYSTSNVGVQGQSASNRGVYGYSTSNVGVQGYSGSNRGVYGSSERSIGVEGYSASKRGVYGSSISNIGVQGDSESNIGVYGSSDSNIGVQGYSASYRGVFGLSETGSGVYGSSTNGRGIYGKSITNTAVAGLAETGTGVSGHSITNVGVFGYSRDDYGVRATSINGVALYANSTNDLAALLEGNVRVEGALVKRSGSFKIDHPLDPANKYLSHSFVESPDMKNIYDGVVTLDNDGETEIELPEWFSALNKDFRYQLTAIGAPGPNLYIAKEISETITDFNNNSSNKKNHFKVAGGTPGMKVSWHVTGIRKDPWANAHRIQVEEDKQDEERGHYIYPELYGQPAENRMCHLLVPEIRERAHHNENK
jgi:hypothetical protein